MKLSLPSNSNTKILIAVAMSFASIIAVVAVTRRRRKRSNQDMILTTDFGAFVDRFEILPSPQPPPPAAKLQLAGLTFAVSDNFDVEGYVSGFGNLDWMSTHDEAKKTAVAVSLVLKNGAKCVGKTVMDELAFGLTGENLHYGTPFNPDLPTHVPGGSSSGSAVAVAADLVDFSLGTDTIGGVRIPASYCGVFGFKSSHGAVATTGVLKSSQSFDTVGWFAREPSVLCRIGEILLPKSSTHRRLKRFIVADDCFQFLRVPKQKTVHVLNKAIEPLSGYLAPKHMNIGQYIALNVPSLKELSEPYMKTKQGASILKALAEVMVLLQGYEFKLNHEEWINTVKPQISLCNSSRVFTAINASHDNVKFLYKVRAELRIALNNLLKDDGILVIPTTSDFPVKRCSKNKLSPEIEDRLLALLSIAGMSGCCQVAVPLGKHDNYNVSISFIAAHGADKFLLDALSDMHSSIQEQINAVSNCVPTEDINGDMDVSELLKEKGNAAFKGKQWNKAVTLYSEAIKQNDSCATYYCNRAAAYLELGCFQQAETDCNQAISIDKKNVKAYLRRGTAREMLLCYKEAAKDFKHALVLEPQNKQALAAEKRLKKLMN